MRVLGIVYLIGYLIDSSLSVVAAFIPWLEGISDAVSLLLSVATIVVLVLACMNKIRPRVFFLLASSYDLFMVGTGFVLAIVLRFKLGARGFQQVLDEPGIEVLNRQFPWHNFFHWTLLAIWMLLGIYGVHAVFTRRDNIQ
jgi:hypothetical protein